MLLNTRKRNSAKFNPGLSANRPSNNWTLGLKREGNITNQLHYRVRWSAPRIKTTKSKKSVLIQFNSSFIFISAFPDLTCFKKDTRWLFYTYIKGAVSRNSVKLGNYKMSVG